MNGRTAKRLRREGIRPRKTLPDYAPDDNKVDYTFNKEEYWKRREKGLYGTIPPVTVHQTDIDEKGKTHRIAVGNKVGANNGLGRRAMGRKRLTDGRFTKKGNARFVQQHMAGKAAGGANQDA